ncbi:uncharacterized protein LOC124133842 isoform X1 [Haliotis rufescens]|uniref:uncharacterized protein LOC124133842 isoform X1 n=2 Tax=Haliotis rufescens TaxID=6454 RepID=UPI00201EF729|nr:uncharacterized protein LOC124133842 isoform X1 [Haliotis rufescens]
MICFHSLLCDIMPAAPTLKCRSTGRTRNRDDGIRVASRDRRGSLKVAGARFAGHVTDETGDQAAVRRGSIIDTLYRSKKMTKSSMEDKNGEVKSEHNVALPESTLKPYKTGILAFLAVVGTAIILKDFGMVSLNLFNTRSTSHKSESLVKSVEKWREADPAILQKYGLKVCDIDRVYADEITEQRFEKEYRFKKPLLVKFRNGAKDWTDPEKWTLKSLISQYGQWRLYSGSSLELVRRGGNGYMGSSFEDYVNAMMSEGSDVEKEPPYVFDRAFYDDTDLSDTLHLPSFLTVDTDLEDSLFFLGSTGTGVSFHNHADAWNAVIFGRKRWFLYNFDQNPPGGVTPGYGQLDWFQNLYPNLTTDQKPTECIQEPGEILYVPEGVYHGTINLGDTIAIGIQKKEAATEAMKYVYEENNLRSKGETTVIDRMELTFKLLDIFPGSAEMNLRLGVLNQEINQMESAETYLQRAASIDPYFVIARLVLAEVKAKLGKNDEAEALMKKALALNPNMWDVYAKYGTFLKQNGRFKDAAEIFRQGIKVEPYQKAFYFYLKDMEEKLGNKEAARRAGQQLRRIEQLEEQQERHN